MNTGLSEESVSGIQRAIDEIIGEEHVTVMFRDRETGEVLYSHRGQHPMRPASNMKLVSGAAALGILGESYRMKTEIYVDGNLENGILQGNLIIKGGGDPTLNKEAFIQFATKLKEYGITEIVGDLIGDDTLFPGETLPPGVDDEGETYCWGARISAITMSPDGDYDASSIIVTAEPGEIGEQPSYKVIPYLSGHEITNAALTVAASEENTLEILRTNDTNQIIISGNLPQGESAKNWVSLQNPTINTLQFMKHIFEQEGIAFDITSAVVQGTVPSSATLIYTHFSPTVAEMFPAFMKFSNNSIADIFVKLIGHEEQGVADYESGLKSVRAYLEQLQIPIDGWQFVDGSGLSHSDRLTSEGITALLHRLQAEPYFETFFDSLPVAGQPDRWVGGTLRERFTESEYENRIFAKTGYIWEVFCLSGYVVGDSGKEYIFSILLEGYEEGIPYIDRGLAEMVKYL
ncbi:D-alanyl-D-alanine carboxypeptidase/D-alanyl-D-alanine endopeptidase [Ureibacillus manganicus]|nr:D-alanyl-D-alanine carboxypeptidase/D-alanyl-D-alanine-endopeptidase [Ureibacillus manganicus]